MLLQSTISIHNNHTWRNSNCFPHLDLFSHTFTTPLVIFNPFNNPLIFTLVPCIVFLSIWKHVFNTHLNSLRTEKKWINKRWALNCVLLIVLSRLMLTLRKGVHCQDGGSVGEGVGGYMALCLIDPFHLVSQVYWPQLSFSCQKTKRVPSFCSY